MLKGGLQTNKYRNCPLVGSMHWCCILHDTPVAELVNKREWGVLGPGSIFSVTEYCYGELQYYCGTNDRNVSARQKKKQVKADKTSSASAGRVVKCGRTEPPVLDGW